MWNLDTEKKAAKKVLLYYHGYGLMRCTLQIREDPF